MGDIMVKERRLSIRVQEVEQAMLKDLSEHSGLSASDLVRQWIRQEHAATFGEPTPKPRHVKPKK